MSKPAALTKREIDVVRLVVEGLCNQQIGDELHIARRTAQSHVSSCLSKLGACSRTQLAVIALRAGIVPLHPEDDDLDREEQDPDEMPSDPDELDPDDVE